MLPNKIILNDRIRKLIWDRRKSAMKINPILTADYISEQVGRSSSWLAQVENGRLKSVKTNDLVNAFCLMEETIKDEKVNRDYLIERLDDEIMYITVTQKHGIYDEQGNITDFSKYLSFQQARGHIQLAGRNLIDEFDTLLNTPIEEIQIHLKKNVKNMYDRVIHWLNRAFNDTEKLFSDEISTINLYLLLETSIKLYEGNCEYFGLNPLNIDDVELLTIKNKLNTDYFVKSKTVIKSLDEYTSRDFDEVVTHFSSEEYMTWKNKHVYIGDDPFPMLVNFHDKPSSEDHYTYYEDVNTATGLSEDKYLYIIKQIYDQFDVCYKRCKDLLRDYRDSQDDIDELYNENEQLKKELEELKSKQQ